MTKQEYNEAHNRIVRVQNDAVHEVIDTVAQVYDVSYQTVFNSWLRWVSVEFNTDNLELFDEWFVDEYTSKDDGIPF